jgi:uncharacterized damage-inducible protein DinB
VNDVLLDSVRHNNWATRRLVAFCRDLGLAEERLTTAGVGTFGGILATLNHVIKSDTSYLRALLGKAPAWLKDDGDTDLENLAKRAEETERLWEELLANPIDVDRVIVVDRGANEVRAGIFLAQALNHANHHRAQVCAILRLLGVQPPDIQAWEYAWASGRLWERTAK